jgi:hypothetical protein
MVFAGLYLRGGDGADLGLFLEICGFGILEDSEQGLALRGD